MWVWLLFPGMPAEPAPQLRGTHTPFEKNPPYRREMHQISVHSPHNHKPRLGDACGWFWNSLVGCKAALGRTEGVGRFAMGLTHPRDGLEVKGMQD